MTATPLTIEGLLALMQRTKDTPSALRSAPYYLSAPQHRALQELQTREAAIRKGKSPLWLAGYDKGREDRFDLARSARDEQVRLAQALFAIGELLGLSEDRCYHETVDDYGEYADYTNWLLDKLRERAAQEAK